MIPATGGEHCSLNDGGIVRASLLRSSGGALVTLRLKLTAQIEPPLRDYVLPSL